MKTNTPSYTAEKVAISRAEHQVFDNPIIFEDSLAIDILSDKSDVYKKRRMNRARLSRYIRAFVAARSRYVEDELALSFKQGVRQYVILGAGLDTFAYRNPYPDLKVFEVDYPATQKWKKEKLLKSKISVPDSLTYTPIDFENQGLPEQLQKSGFNPNEPAFFSWLGVTMYLTPEIIMKTMQFIFQSSAENQIIFDYVIPYSSKSFLHQLAFRMVNRRIRIMGEPWKCFFEPEILINNLKDIGFTEIEDIGPDDINKKYFNNRFDRLKVGGFGRLMNIKH